MRSVSAYLAGACRSPAKGAVTSSLFMKSSTWIDAGLLPAPRPTTAREITHLIALPKRRATSARAKARTSLGRPLGHPDRCLDLGLHPLRPLLERDHDQRSRNCEHSLPYESSSTTAQALKLVLEHADISIPALGKTLLSRDDRQTLLILAASTECFPRP